MMKRNRERPLVDSSKLSFYMSQLFSDEKKRVYNVLCIGILSLYPGHYVKGDFVLDSFVVLSHYNSLRYNR